MTTHSNGPAKEPQPSMAKLVLDAARRERELDCTRQNAFPTLAAPPKLRRGSVSDLASRRQSADGTVLGARPKGGGRRQSSTPFTSWSESNGNEEADPMLGGGMMARTMGKLAEAAGVREVEPEDEVVPSTPSAWGETSELRGPFSVDGSVKGKGKSHKKSSSGSATAAGPGGNESDSDAVSRPPRSTRSRRTFSRSNTERAQAEPTAAGQAKETEEQEVLVNGEPGSPTSPSKGWATLRGRFAANPGGEAKPSGSNLTKGLTGKELTTELATGFLPIIMLKMSMDRDEHGQHRVPILMNYLKLRVTDSAHALHASHAVFRIELEYGDKLLKWVIYRELRDFVNLHAAYRASNLVARGANDINLPPFPKTSLPYFNLLKKEGRHITKQDFAKLQRQNLETYLLQLVRATMFKPEANRLCKFLEISALSLALATRGGFQGKQGYLRVMSSGASRRKKPGFHPLEWKERREPKWFIVRESYLVSVDEPDQSAIFDVFVVDDQFTIQRPTRLLKQGIHLLDRFETSDEKGEKDLKDHDEIKPHHGGVGDPEDPSATDLAAADPKQLKNASSHTFYIINAERKVKVVAKSERQMDQFIASIESMAANSLWAGKNRFDSFAPIRMNVAAQWLIDGRDYFWNLSRALLLAKERIYIHDWWLSPELYLRRPPALNQKWRLDRLLKRKADEGVQIFVIVYKEVSNGFTPVESLYTKQRLLGLSPNIHIQRSPSHTGTGNLLWSHHEKMCVIDETIAFMGGLDLCFGRWDSPGHVMTDDAPGGLDAIEKFDPEQDDVEAMQLWPGKDYSNQRVSDFFNLKAPEEDMYDRAKVPRQPWHDIGLQLIGQPARDLCRHFIQRWNYLLRTKNHTRLMPFLLPPADFTPKQLTELGIVGTCEAQICRSCGPWSIGTPEKVEHSIQTSYIKAIQMSDHFVYIENQFFITSCTVDGTVVTNQIGDALVNRAIRAHAEGQPWRAIIVIPTMPGYPSPLNEDGAGSVRLIIDCQNRSICRGETSIYGRLRAAGIQPEEYITFFSLRGWGKLKTGQLTTEGVYIHAKAMIVDDRLAIIGSANINERSQRGDRDSELACIIRDTDMIDGVMGGQPYRVGRFAHTMRVRLMREHLGLDVDALEAEESNMDLLDRKPKEAFAEEPKPWDPDREEQAGVADVVVEKTQSHCARAAELASEAGQGLQAAGAGTLEGIGFAGQKAVEGVGKTGKLAQALLHEDTGPDTYPTDDPHDGMPDGAPVTGAEKLVQGKTSKTGFASTVVPTWEEKVMAEGRPAHGKKAQGPSEAPSRLRVNFDPPHAEPPGDASTGTASKNGAEERAPMDNLEGAEGRKVTQESKDTSDVHKLDAVAAKQGATEDTDQVKDERGKAAGEPDVPALEVSEAPDPGKDEAVANNNFYAKSIRRHLNARMSPFNIPVPAPEIDPHGLADPICDDFFKDVWLTVAVRNTQIFRKVFRCVPDDNVTTWQGYKEYQTWEARHNKPLKEEDSPETPVSNSTTQDGDYLKSPLLEGRARGLSVGDASTRERAGSDAGNSVKGHKKSPSKGGKGNAEDGFTQHERDQMEDNLREVQGNLILFPTRFMEAEDLNNNFLFSKDRLPPLSIYN